MVVKKYRVADNLEILPVYLAIFAKYLGLFFLRLTFDPQSCILTVQVNIPFECLRMR